MENRERSCVHYCIHPGFEWGVSGIPPHRHVVKIDQTSRHEGRGVYRIPPCNDEK